MGPLQLLPLTCTGILTGLRREGGGLLDKGGVPLGVRAGKTIAVPQRCARRSGRTHSRGCCADVGRYGTLERWLLSSSPWWLQRRAWALRGVAAMRRRASERGYGRSGGSTITTPYPRWPFELIRLRAGADRSGSRRVCACPGSRWYGSPAHTTPGGPSHSRSCCCFGWRSRCSPAVPRALRDVAELLV